MAVDGVAAAGGGIITGTGADGAVHGDMAVAVAVVIDITGAEPGSVVAGVAPAVTLLADEVAAGLHLVAGVVQIRIDMAGAETVPTGKEGAMTVTADRGRGRVVARQRLGIDRVVPLARPVAEVAVAIGGDAGAGAGAGGGGVVAGEEAEGGVRVGGHAIDVGQGRQVDGGVAAGAGAVRCRVRAREGVIMGQGHVGLMQAGDVVLVDLADKGAAVAIGAVQGGNRGPVATVDDVMADVGAGT